MIYRKINTSNLKPESDFKQIRNALANLKRELRKEAMVKCADSIDITVQKTKGVPKVTLPMILPIIKKAKLEYICYLQRSTEFVIC